MFRRITCKIRHCLHNVAGPALALATLTDCLLCDAVQGLAADMVQASTADAAPTAATDSIIAATTVGPIEANKGGRADEQPDVKLPNEDVHASEALTPAGSVSGVKAASTARKSGSQTWFGKAGGILGRWTVPLKVKKEPESRHWRVTETIDLT